MKKNLISVLLTICMLVCLVPMIQVSAETCVLDRLCWKSHWERLQCQVEAVKISSCVPDGSETFNLNKSGTVVGYVKEKEYAGRPFFVCYIAPAKSGDIVALPEDSSYLFNIEQELRDANTVKEVDLKGIDTSSVKKMEYMFESLTKLTKLNVTAFNTSEVTDMRGMFFGCQKLLNLDVTRFDTSKVTDMGYIFCMCANLVGLDVTHFNTCNVENMECMFSGCHWLQSLDVTKFNTSKVTDMSNMFCGCQSLERLDVNHFDTSKVTNMRHMFFGCDFLKRLNLTHFDMRNVKDMSAMFWGCTSLARLDISSFDAKRVNMEGMFSGCSNLKDLHIFHSTTDFIERVKRDLPEVQISVETGETCVIDRNFWGDRWRTIQYEVSAVRMAISVPKGAEIFNLNESKTVVGYVQDKVCYIAPVKFKDTVALPEDSSYLFKRGMVSDEPTVEEIDLRGVDTSGVKNMSRMFEGLKKLKKLCITSFDTSNVTDMAWMFRSCSGLEQLDVCSFDTRNVNDMSRMFEGCIRLKSLDVSHFDTSNVESAWGMFANCPKLESLRVFRTTPDVLDRIKRDLSASCVLKFEE